MTAVQTCVNILPDMMARNPQNLARDEATASDVSRGFVFPNGLSNISLYQTGPSRDYTRVSSSSWNRGIGQQYLRGNSGRSDTQARYPDSFQNVSQAHVTSTDSSAAIIEHSMFAPQIAAAQWPATGDFIPEGGVEMARWASQNSFHSGQGSVHGTDLNHDHTSSSQLQQSFPQMSFPLLSADSGFEDDSNGSGLYSNSTAFEDCATLHEERNTLFSNAESFVNDTFEAQGGAQHRTYVSEDCRFGLFSTVSEGNLAMEGHPALIPSTVSEASFSTLSDQAPYGWDCAVSYQDSAQNSPTFTANETWPTMPVLTSSPTEELASDFRALSPRNSRKTLIQGARESSKHGEPDAFDESFHLTRQSVEMDNIARDHPYYHTPIVGVSDGLYHCPWEGENTCQHKPEKLKCNYDKFVDSHLKPYRCKVAQCENARFSSTACLLRHEREAHAMHGHGDKPFLCTHEGCERGVIGNGFPRHWNLRDHMKRVHNDTGPAPRSNTSGSPTPSHTTPTTRAPRKRKNDASAQDKEKEPASKKTQTSSVVAPSPPPAQQQAQQVNVAEEPSLVEQWQQRRLQLLKLVEQLDDPRDPQVMRVLSHAGKELQVLAGTSKRISNAPASMKRER